MRRSSGLSIDRDSGLPMVFTHSSDADKKKYLSELFEETYLKDILERHAVAYPEALSLIANELSSPV